MSRHRRWGVVRIVTLLIAAGALPVAAQLPTCGVGRPPTAAEIQAWDLTIPPDGQGLPPGSGTAAIGQALYAERCASCHGETGEDPKYSRLGGGHGTLATDKPVRTIGRSPLGSKLAARPPPPARRPYRASALGDLPVARGGRQDGYAVGGKGRLSALGGACVGGKGPCRVGWAVTLSQPLARTGRGDFHHPAPPLMWLVASRPKSGR